MTYSMWTKAAREKYFSHLPSYSLGQFRTHNRSSASYRASNSDVLNTRVLPPPACWYFWQSSISMAQLTSACHLCGLSCLKNPGVSRVSQWWEDHFPINKRWNLYVWKIPAVVWCQWPFEGTEMSAPFLLGSLGCLIPGTDAFPFHYQKPLRSPGCLVLVSCSHY